MELFWHRRDLRIGDNRGLAAAAAAVPVVPVYVLDDRILGHAGPPRVAFLLDGLDALRGWYRDRGSDLLVVRGDPREALVGLARDHDAGAVRWNRDYSGLARSRDEAVTTALDGAGIEYGTYHDRLLHEPGSVRTNAGEPYSVFSYFWKKWRDRPKDRPIDPPDGGSLVAADDLEAAGREPLPGPDDLGIEPPEATVPPAGPAAARERLEAFLDGPIHRYAEDRDVPAADGTSRLSADLAFGAIGIRDVWAATTDAVDAAPDGAARDSVTEFRRQLAWREFYAHVLRFHPRVVTENYRDYPNPIPWRDDPEEIRAWKAGETGYPIVDAGMRQLRDEAWMHNRVRMIVASFLTKDLLVDWRVGYDWFRERLVDHDAANDSGGWQWAAGTGTDAQPYFRVFNPTTQGERYDPDADYVAAYVPEIRDADPATIHGWTELSAAEREAAAPDYPAPIVDHAERRESAIAAFEAARGDD